MPVLSRGDVVTCNGKSWTIARKLGEGQFAEVYQVHSSEDPTKRYAMKIEKSVRILKGEHKALQALQHVPQVCRLYEHGTYGEKHFLILESHADATASPAPGQLLGCNMAEHRKTQGGRLPLSEVKRVGRSVLDALRGMHAAGFIHRDVKPANFCQVKDKDSFKATASWHAIDFGLARRHLDADGSALPPRTDAAFRGSTTYASVNAHVGVDLGRRDDLWSWLYMLVELVEGSLPWRQDGAHGGEAGAPAAATHAASNALFAQHGDQKSKDAVLSLKQAALDDAGAMAPSSALPECLVSIHTYLRTLGYGDAPDYEQLNELLELTPEEREKEQQQQHASELALQAARQAAKEIEAASLQQRGLANGQHTTEGRTDEAGPPPPPACSEQTPTAAAGMLDRQTDRPAGNSKDSEETPAGPPAGHTGPLQRPMPSAVGLHTAAKGLVTPAAVPKAAARQEPSAASLLVASIMQNSANARKAAEAQRAAKAEAAAKEAAAAQAAAAKEAVQDRKGSADVKQLLSTLTASLTSHNTPHGVKRTFKQRTARLRLDVSTVKVTNSSCNQLEQRPAALNGTALPGKKAKTDGPGTSKGPSPRDLSTAAFGDPLAKEAPGTGTGSPQGKSTRAVQRMEVAGRAVELPRQPKRRAAANGEPLSDPSLEKGPGSADKAQEDDSKRTLRPRDTRTQRYNLAEMLQSEGEDEDMEDASLLQQQSHDLDSRQEASTVPSQELTDEDDEDDDGGTGRQTRARGKSVAAPLSKPSARKVEASSLEEAPRKKRGRPRKVAVAGTEPQENTPTTITPRHTRATRAAAAAADGKDVHSAGQTDTGRRQLRSRGGDAGQSAEGAARGAGQGAEDAVQIGRATRRRRGASVTPEQAGDQPVVEGDVEHQANAASSPSEDDDLPLHVLAAKQLQATEAQPVRASATAPRGGPGRGRGRPRGRPPLRGGRGRRGRTPSESPLRTTTSAHAPTMVHSVTGLPTVHSAKGAFCTALEEALSQFVQVPAAAGRPQALLQQLQALPASQQLLLVAAVAKAMLPPKEGGGAEAAPNLPRNSAEPSPRAPALPSMDPSPPADPRAAADTVQAAAHAQPAAAAVVDNIGELKPDLDPNVAGPADAAPAVLRDGQKATARAVDAAATPKLVSGAFASTAMAVATEADAAVEVGGPKLAAAGVGLVLAATIESADLHHSGDAEVPASAGQDVDNSAAAVSRLQDQACLLAVAAGSPALHGCVPADSSTRADGRDGSGRPLEDAVEHDLPDKGATAGKTAGHTQQLAPAAQLEWSQGAAAAEQPSPAVGPEPRPATTTMAAVSGEDRNLLKGPAVRTMAPVSAADAVEWLSGLETYVHDLLNRAQASSKRVTRASIRGHAQ